MKMVLTKCEVGPGVRMVCKTIGRSLMNNKLTTQTIVRMNSTADGGFAAIATTSGVLTLVFTRNTDSAGKERVDIEMGCMGTYATITNGPTIGVDVCNFVHRNGRVSTSDHMACAKRGRSIIDKHAIRPKRTKIEKQTASVTAVPQTASVTAVPQAPRPKRRADGDNTSENGLDRAVRTKRAADNTDVSAVEECFHDMSVS